VAFKGLAAHEVIPRRIIDLSGERFAQIYDRRGTVIAATPALAGNRLLSVSEVVLARRRAMLTRRNVRSLTVIAHRLATLLLISLPAALLLASIAGYQVANSAMRPVERMRVRAASIGDSDLSERLPTPGTRDELDRLADTLNDLLGRLQRSIEHERRVVSDASHELRTPISVLRTRLDVAARAAGSSAQDLRGVLDEARGDVHRLWRLADDLLVLARADQGRLPLRRAPLDVQDVLEAAAARHHVDAENAERAVSTSVLIDGGAVVLADADRLAQVIDNLIVNSLRYGAGTVELVAQQSADLALLELVVMDRGAGFPGGFAERAFDRFSQADEARGQGGSGLGLAIVEAIVRAHGGSVAANNRPGGGARVRVQLPLA